ncbi:MAG TPA: energy transducer TonB [Candidatus Acidoferrum sp.]|nr:energy transducer TonB [Candidatus Acidoferrum sp.]
MSPEPRSVSETSPKESLGTLSGCLVDGDAEQLTRQRRVKRRALAISIFLQSAVLTVLILVPLFSKAERISLNIVTPMVPYGHPSGHPRNPPRPTTPRPRFYDGHRPFFPSPLAPQVRELSTDEDPIGSQDFSPIGDPSKGGMNCPGCVDIGGKDNGPRPPQPPVETPTRPRLIHTQIDPAMLIRRVEPKYPALAIQTHREGRVELRAIIGTDGTIQSLQVVSGDPFFLTSAKEAVQQWRYRPTYLNGQAVEIDTFITVVYTLQH